MRFERILVPVDFSPQSTEAAIIAVQLANRNNAALRVLHIDSFPGAATVAVEPVYIPPDFFGGLQADYDRRVQEELDRLQAELEERKTTAVAIEADRYMGEVEPGIVAEARDWDCDLIVMGSSGLSGTARLILGSVADKVSRHATCPVLITRAKDREQRPIEPFRKVLAAIDYSDAAGPVARLAADMVAPGGSLELLHVWESPHLSALNVNLGWQDSGELTTLIERARAAEAEQLDRFRADLGLENASCYVAAWTDGVPGALLERADEIHADLLVVGAHGRRNLGERILGTVADRVLRHAHLPVLLLPPDALADELEQMELDQEMELDEEMGE